jgi:hypothetical protein
MENQKEESKTIVGDSRENFKENLETLLDTIKKRAEEDSRFLLLFARMDDEEEGAVASEIFHKVTFGEIQSIFLQIIGQIDARAILGRIPTEPQKKEKG